MSLENPLPRPPGGAIFHTESPEETVALGERLAADLPPGSVVLLVGPLGAGKTVLAQGMARGIGVAERVISPTYTIVSEYQGGRSLLSHVDLYRIEGRDQMENLGLEDILRGEGITLVEWGEKLEGGAALARLRVTLSIAPGGGRDILVEDLG